MQTKMYEGRLKASAFCLIIMEHIEFALIMLPLGSQDIYCL